MTSPAPQDWCIQNGACSRVGQGRSTLYDSDIPLPWTSPPTKGRGHGCNSKSAVA